MCENLRELRKNQKQIIWTCIFFAITGVPSPRRNTNTSTTGTFPISRTQQGRPSYLRTILRSWALGIIAYLWKNSIIQFRMQCFFKEKFKNQSKNESCALGSSSIWTCQILNIEYLLLFSTSRRSGKKNWYSKFKIRHVQIDEMPRT